jgi:glycosyltransferase involved in cell wall biosynthesis
MKVLFDYQFFELQQFGGITRYFAEIISSFPSHVTFNIGIKYSNNQYLKEKNLIPIKPLNDQRQEFLKGIEFYGKGRIYNYLKKINPTKYYDCYQKNREYSIELLKKQEFDIFHPTYYDDYFLDYLGNKPFVITIHDMTYEKFPEFFPIADKTAISKKNLALKASHIIAVSQNTKKDIIDFWGIDAKKISVIYHGANQLENRNGNHLNMPKDYFLFVGARNLYKNFIFFINSIADILIDKNLNLVCTGKPFSNDEIQLFEYLKIKDRIFHYYANELELASLYQNAIALVFPSLYEGFGIPILEAFVNSCPVLLSNTSCFPEIAGNAALYFDPKSNIEIQDLLNSIINNPTLREKLILYGEAKLKSFSWEKASSETIAVYEKCNML